MTMGGRGGADPEPGTYIYILYTHVHNIQYMYILYVLRLFKNSRNPTASNKIPDAVRQCMTVQGGL